MHVFNEADFGDYLRSLDQAIVEAIRKEADDYVLNVNESEYVAHLAERFALDVPTIRRDLVHVDSREELIPAERFPNSFDVRPGRSYPRQVLTYYVPVEGDIRLVGYTPSTRLLWTKEMAISGNSLTFDVVVWSDDPERVKSEVNGILNNLEAQNRNLAVQAEAFNQGLEAKARAALKVRREELKKRSSFVEALGVPVRKRTDLPSTFAVPPPAQRRRITVRPDVTSRVAPDPTLDATVYTEILQTIWDLGRTLERLPSTYAAKDEETLRDHILLYLTPRFEGSSTGETFNKSGKTDILLRYEASNVFIAECKFWSGKKALLEAIDQLLRYLTWRDSKACIVLFVANKDFSAVLASIRQTLPTHPQFVRHVADRDESWFEYRFSLPGDPDREIWLSVLSFHLPRD